MKEISFSLMLFLISGLLNSQTPMLLRSTLGSGGSSMTVTSGGTKSIFPQSIGQYGLTGVFNKRNLELRQGFIQPITIVRSFQEAEKINVSIYPNPFSSVIYVKPWKEFSDSGELKITDLAGKTLYVQKYLTDEINQINLSSLSGGIYILTIRKDHFQINYKIIKN